ncbi:MAG: thiamine phosphate synthase [Nocardioides sp.]|uniref:thiamine phosphate synthase n=1 Tax=Nocardioides sp. TaxID=35761 RepID=UPI0039E6F318
MPGPGWDRWRGRSCHTRGEVARAAVDGFDYVTLSPYAASESKAGYGPPLGAGALAGHPLPVFALGGIGPHNAAHALAEGADGVAVMGAVMRAEEPAAVVTALLACLRDPA